MWLYSNGSSFNRSFAWFLALIKDIRTPLDSANHAFIIALSLGHVSSVICTMAFEKALDEGGHFLSSSLTFSMIASSKSAATILGSSSLCHAILGFLHFGGAVFFFCPNLSFSTTGSWSLLGPPMMCRVSQTYSPSLMCVRKESWKRWKMDEGGFSENRRRLQKIFIIFEENKYDHKSRSA
jgi:hypothetical protein